MNEKQYLGYVSTNTKIRRALWNVVWLLFFQTLPTTLFWWWRWSLLRLFGAQVDWRCHVYSSVKIWAPWNLKMERNSCLGPNVICYNQNNVLLKEGSVVSQYSYLCTAGHETDKPNTADAGLITAAITLGENAWVGTRAYVGMGVTIGKEAIVGATASVYKDVEPYTIVGGNPAKFIKKRIIC